MNDKIVFGQYVHRDSLIHRLDSRVKLIILFLMMIAVFLVPKDNFVILGIIGIIPILAVAFSKISVFKYLKSLKQIVFIILFSFIFQMILNNEGNIVLSTEFKFTYINIVVASIILILYFVVRKYLPFKMLFLIGVMVLDIYLLSLPMAGDILNKNPIIWNIYEGGLIHGTFLFGRVVVIIITSSVLTLTTKPTDLTNAIEWLLKPLELIKIKTSIFAMMISIALRFIPTLFNETNKILKAQASRGVDFNEGSLASQIKQIVSLLVPMFVISIKRAIDLADTMEARGYIPGEKRTRLVVMKFNVLDYIVLFSSLILFTLLVLGKCGIYAL